MWKTSLSLTYTATTDYIEATKNVNFDLGDAEGSTACASFSTTEDEQVEGVETFLVQLSSTDSVDISGGSSIINIEDNDGEEVE